MNLLAYCAVASSPGAQALRVAGIGGRPVEVVWHEDLGAAASYVDEAPRAADVAAVLRYRDVVEAYAGVGPAVPLRYGTVFGDEGELREVLHREGPRLRSLLDRVDGTLEMAVLATLPPLRGVPKGSEMHAPSGRVYLQARREGYASADAEVEQERSRLDRLRAHFAGLYTEALSEARSTAETGPAAVAVGPKRWAGVYFLVPRGSVGPFRQRFRALVEADETGLTLVGPRAAYTFVTAAPAAEGEGEGHGG